MTDIEAVIQIQNFLANSVQVIDFESESIVIEGVVYVWQRNNGWDEEFTATVIALLLGNTAPLFERPPSERLHDSPF
jgi:hypothetical protein